MILLARWSQKYCAIKFTDFPSGDSREGQDATYQSFYQPDGTGDFRTKSVILNEAKLSQTRLHGIGRLAFSLGTTDIQCGPLKLMWSAKDWVYFLRPNQGDWKTGAELAPTGWTAVSQVNVFDPRLKWYGYAEARQRATVPIPRL
jgi:hypothetical protein